MKKSSLDRFVKFLIVLLFFFANMEGYSQVKHIQKKRDFNFNQFKLLPSPPVPKVMFHIL